MLRFIDANCRGPLLGARCFCFEWVTCEVHGDLLNPCRIPRGGYKGAPTEEFRFSPSNFYSTEITPAESELADLKFTRPFDLDEPNFPKNEWFKLLQKNWISVLVAGRFPPKLEPAVLLLAYEKFV
jgi:hypothetical protein